MKLSSDLTGYIIDTSTLPDNAAKSLFKHLFFFESLDPSIEEVRARLSEIDGLWVDENPMNALNQIEQIKEGLKGRSLDNGSMWFTLVSISGKNMISLTYMNKRALYFCGALWNVKAGVAEHISGVPPRPPQVMLDKALGQLGRFMHMSGAGLSLSGISVDCLQVVASRQHNEELYWLVRTGLLPICGRVE